MLVHIAWGQRDVVLHSTAPSNTGAFWEAVRVAVAASVTYRGLARAMKATASEWGYVTLLPASEPDGRQIHGDVQPDWTFWRGVPYGHAPAHFEDRSGE